MLVHQKNGKGFLFDRQLPIKKNPDLKTKQTPTAVYIIASREQEKDF